MVKTTESAYLKLKSNLDHKDYELIHMLEIQCARNDQITLKLELDYKLSDAQNRTADTPISDINEFMYFNGEELIGYMGICCFGGISQPLEITGMVHPMHRRQGIFSKLMELVVAECRRRNAVGILALCDKKSISGQEFLKKISAVYKFSEFEMYLNHKSYKTLKKQQPSGITFRKAVNADASEITRQNMIYFGDDWEEENEDSEDSGILLPEEEEKRGMTIYIAEKGDRIIGKVNLQMSDGGTGGIYGLGVLPEFRGKGYGGAILIFGVEKLKDAKATEVMLQVAAENGTALNLYKSCGFQETSVMDYFELK
ncbi:GNAT family N-acetyltransferase [Lacrimispora defluvii]|uniref:GNAT family N-acetyltransferase n=1 Tax=Lacrimispora defluvii TaxID=2719233 RepID=A0ABX1VVG2_9FIRM|nr:GNAT family N-acetyltransferase [Lacrimispora defluvii]NNJ31759.1 GNAT family N-acetyltransferase [Lacrimispora defluvii]